MAESDEARYQAQPSTDKDRDEAIPCGPEMGVCVHYYLRDPSRVGVRGPPAVLACANDTSAMGTPLRSSIGLDEGRFMKVVLSVTDTPKPK